MNLKQLSKELGLSPTTVSRALNGYPEVSEATRVRIVAAAKLHGYIANTRAKGLATGRAMAIGHVIAGGPDHEMVNPIFSDFIAGAGETYARSGYEMMISVVDEGDEEAAYRSLRARRAVDGVILHAPKLHDPRVAVLEEIGLPFAVHGRIPNHAAPYCWLDVNNRASFLRATDLLLDLGHRRIALVNGPETWDFADRRRRGFEDALASRGLNASDALAYSGPMTEDAGYRFAHTTLAEARPPTAYLVSSIILALGVRRALEEVGRTLGRDVSVVIHDDALSYLDNGGAVPVFTATRASVRLAGRQLAQMLLNRIADPASKPAQELMEASLVIGRSTGPAPSEG